VINRILEFLSIDNEISTLGQALNYMNKKIILSFETSCDDTSIAIIRGSSTDFESLPELILMNSFSQEILLKKWGGVVPEIAARNHLEKIHPLLVATLNDSKINMNEIDAIAVTTHPGLMGPLLTGINAAKTLALIYKKPIYSANHLYAHLEAIHLTAKIAYPYLGLLVSGGHSLYALVTSPREFEILGSTIDDAAGEAFDKGGKILGLGYPAGKEIDVKAKMGDRTKYTFPISYQKKDDANLSFSGVKTALRNFVENPENQNAKVEDVCASYQEAIVAALARKLLSALKMARVKTSLKSLPIVVGGGVACNSRLRAVILENFTDAHFVAPKFCTDNASMIANLALRNFNDCVSFPLSLTLDAKGQFISKDLLLDEARKK
jgi:N6-L-threonylcarbamoyladenine synthase